MAKLWVKGEAIKPGTLIKISTYYDRVSVVLDCPGSFKALGVIGIAHFVASSRSLPIFRDDLYETISDSAI